MSDGEETLAFQLKAAKIPFEREYQFHPDRRWRLDFLLRCDKWGKSVHAGTWAVEVEGGAFTGGHKRGKAADTDTEKANEALLMGWKVLRFTTAQVNSGEALATIERALKQ